MRSSSETRWDGRDGHVVVVDEELDVEALCDGEPGRLGVIALLERAVRFETEDGLLLVGERDAVDERPCNWMSTRDEEADEDETDTCGRVDRC